MLRSPLILERRLSLAREIWRIFDFLGPRPCCDTRNDPHRHKWNRRLHFFILPDLDQHPRLLAIPFRDFAVRNRPSLRDAPSGLIAAGSVGQNREGDHGGWHLEEGRTDRKQPDFPFGCAIHGSANG